MLIILDADETLVRAGEGIKLPNRLSEQELIPGVVERCAALRRDGHRLAIASNQAGVVLGYGALEDAVERISWLARQVGAEHWLISTWHKRSRQQIRHDPENGVSYSPFFRKPQPGMLMWLMLRLESPVTDTMFVGDSPEDQAAAIGAGVRFEWAKDFFAS